MLDLTFIINPISGHGQKKVVEKQIQTVLSANFNYQILYTKGLKHAIELSKEAAEHSDIIVAVGGDGSIHEVGQSLIGKSTKLGIIPMGSGNGLARHLNIPLNIKQAIETINIGNFKTIDCIDFGNLYSLNVSGLGFDAHIAHQFANLGKRGFKSYIKLSISEYFKYKSKTYQIEVNGETIDTTAFLISIANSSQFGNNAYISPKGLIDDGYFELVILSPFPKIYAPSLGLKLFTKSIKQSKYITVIKTKQAKISCDEAFLFHIDGEPMGEKKELDINVKPSSLNIIVP